MAWEEFERAGVKGITGDQPIDELALRWQKLQMTMKTDFLASQLL
jgi:hypothetical protein